MPDLDVLDAIEQEQALGNQAVGPASSPVTPEPGAPKAPQPKASEKEKPKEKPPLELKGTVGGFGLMFIGILDKIFPGLADQLGISDPETNKIRNGMDQLIGNTHNMTPADIAKRLEAGLKGDISHLGLEFTEAEKETFLKGLNAALEKATDYKGEIVNSVFVAELIKNAKEAGVDVDPRLADKVVPGLKVAAKGVEYSNPTVVASSDFNNLGLRGDEGIQGLVEVYSMNKFGTLDHVGMASPHDIQKSMGASFKVESFHKAGGEGAQMDGFVMTNAQGQSLYFNGTSMDPENWDKVPGLTKNMTTPAPTPDELAKALEAQTKLAEEARLRADAAAEGNKVALGQQQQTHNQSGPVMAGMN